MTGPLPVVELSDAMAGWGRSDWDAWRGNWGHSSGDRWGDRSGEWQVAGSAARRSFSQVAGSDASRSVQPRDWNWWSDDVHPGLRYFDTEHIQDMDQDEQEEAKTTSRRVENGWLDLNRGAILNSRLNMIIKKSFFVAWHKRLMDQVAGSAASAIPTTAQHRLCCRCESPIGEVEGDDAIDSDGGIVFHCVHCDRPAHFHGHGMNYCWRMRCSRTGLL